jgi:hypothetical protein
MTERYMIVTYILKPNGKWDEITEFKKHYRLKHIQSSKVILDLKDKKVVKNGLNPEAGFDDMIEFYKRLLGDKLTPHLPKD